MSATIPITALNERFVSIDRDGETKIWLAKRLWELAKDLPVFNVALPEGPRTLLKHNICLRRQINRTSSNAER